MPRALGFRFRDWTSVAIFLAVLAGVVIAYASLVERSVRRHPEGARKAVLEHCRFMVGREAGSLGREAFEERWQACENFRIADISARGGILHPVIVRIRLDPSAPLPLGKEVLVFRSNVVGFKVLPGLAGLSSGHWEFNPAVAYSERYYRGSY